LTSIEGFSGWNDEVRIAEAAFLYKRFCVPVTNYLNDMHVAIVALVTATEDAGVSVPAIRAVVTAGGVRWGF
jgi:hypothetical protein